MKTEMIPCEEVVKRLWAFLDDELDASSQEQVRAHLEMCARCFPAYDFQRAYFQMMQRLSAEPEPPRLRSRIFQALLAETG